MSIARSVRRWRWIIAAIGVGGGVIALGAWGMVASRWVTTEIDADPPMRIRHVRGLQLRMDGGNEAGDERRRVVFRAEPADAEREALVTVSVERGLRIVTALTHVEMLAGLARNIERTYPERFPGFHKERERSFFVDGRRAVEVMFTYASPHGATIRQRLWVIAYDGDTALSVAAQARADDFAAIEKAYFMLIFDFDHALPP